MSMENDYIMETNEPELIQEELLYNCTECSSAIEILSINEDECTIEFQCINNKHKKKMPIKEYLNKMKNFNDRNINNDKCDTHNLEYQCYCLDCNAHLCKECLKSRNHFNHFKNNIIETQPTKKEINIFTNIIKNYEEKLNLIEKEKIIRTKELNNKIKKAKNRLKEKKELKINENNNKMELELKQIKEEYTNNMNDIRKQLEKEITMKKYEYELKLKEISNKYKLMNEYNNIIFNKKIEKIDMIYLKEIKEYGYENRIENLNNLKRLNEIIYNTYNNYNNNYYNAINIENRLINYKNKEINNELNDVYENMIKKKKKSIINEYEDKIKNKKYRIRI